MEKENGLAIFILAIAKPLTFGFLFGCGLMSAALLFRNFLNVGMFS